LRAENVEILGELDNITTLTSNYVISPFIIFISTPPAEMTADRKIKRIFSVPLSFLMKIAKFRQDSYAYKYEGYIIWGTTARLLR